MTDIIRLTNWVNEAVNKGAKLLIGGKNEGAFMRMNICLLNYSFIFLFVYCLLTSLFLLFLLLIVIAATIVENLSNDTQLHCQEAFGYTIL